MCQDLNELTNRDEQWKHRRAMRDGTVLDLGSDYIRIRGTDGKIYTVVPIQIQTGRMSVVAQLGIEAEGG